MKKAIAILFLVTYLFSATELYQLLKIPVLFEHFFEHKAKNSQMSVWDFLELHYSGNHLENHPQNDDFEKDQKLPFMVYTNDMSFYCVYTPSFTIEIKSRMFQSRKQKPAFDEKFTNNDFLSAIWQPPRSC